MTAGEADMHVHEIIASRVQDWGSSGYLCEEFPAISEILEYQTDPETSSLRYLRKPQLQALETYWYLRLVEGTPQMFDLYRRLFRKQTELLDALGLKQQEIKDFAIDEGIEALWSRITTDDEFVRRHRLESVRETLTLAYPSYILALAMGAGKTCLIGAIVATEFAMAQEYPNAGFVSNALVFAPGKTIIESLRELYILPYDRILPPRLYKRFAASLKLTFTRDGDPDVNVIEGSYFNVVVTNTEKIRIQKEAVPTGMLKGVRSDHQDAARQEVANARLVRIASLPRLAVFSDEAHHTYGQSLLGRWTKDSSTGLSVFREAGIKKVRKTVDYLAEKADVVCVVNTTGTPYFERQPLKDVVYWYGLSQGISDGYLKEVAGSIYSYDFDPASTHHFIRAVISDFFSTYGAVRLPKGSQAKMAIYFPQTDDLDDLRPAVDAALAALGQSPAIVLRNTSKSSQDEIDAFNRLNNPDSPHRVILLVNKGTEGWNCPSLFACALARKLKTSNNFVLQASTRCLRQVPGNNEKARIYLSADNRAILDRQLQETYGETIDDLNRTGRETMRAVVRLMKAQVDPLVVTQEVRTVYRVEKTATPLCLEQPAIRHSDRLKVSVFTPLQQHATSGVLHQVGETSILENTPAAVGLYAASVRLSGLYRISFWDVYAELTRLYGESGEVPVSHLPGLAHQVEQHVSEYRVKTEKVERAIALIRYDEAGRPRGFVAEKDSDGAEAYTTEITYFRDREHLLIPAEKVRYNRGSFGFHYSPYNFDSRPEQSFFEQMLVRINMNPEDVEDIYYTGAITDPDKTQFFVEYRDDKGKWRHYTPDFVVRMKSKGDEPGKCLIVEIKAERERNHPIDGEHGRKAMAIRKWTELDADRIRYEMIFTSTDSVSADQIASTWRVVEGEQA